MDVVTRVTELGYRLRCGVFMGCEYYVLGRIGWISWMNINGWMSWDVDRTGGTHWWILMSGYYSHMNSNLYRWIPSVFCVDLDCILC